MTALPSQYVFFVREKAQKLCVLHMGYHVQEADRVEHIGAATGRLHADPDIAFS